MNSETHWFEDYAEEVDDIQIDEYDITASPNDFNVLTLFSFIETGAIRIPGFQRNYVWDKPRASKLVESLIIGIPVPQLFLYEQTKNKFLVVDGQQRLMSLYYFIKQRFPRKEKRVELRIIFDEHGKMPDHILHDDNYFENFTLTLPTGLPEKVNKFQGLKYTTLGDYKTQLDLRPIRNILVKQNSPNDDDSSVYELFNRLNTGGVNLTPQEIRTSMYHSDFYEVLYRVNQNSEWRRVIASPVPDLHMKDIEIILRGFAMLIESDGYAPSMVRFLNKFSRKCAKNGTEKNSYLEQLFISFCRACSDLESATFVNELNNRFNIALYEAVFTAACEPAFLEQRLPSGKLDQAAINSLATDQTFVSAATEGTTSKANVAKRLERARAIIGAL